MKMIRSFLILLLALPVLTACAAADTDLCGQWEASEQQQITLTDLNGITHCYTCRKVGPPGFEVEQGECWQVVVDDLNR